MWTYNIESFFTIFGPCINVLNYKLDYMQTYDPASVLLPTIKWMFDGEMVLTCLLEFGSGI